MAITKEKNLLDEIVQAHFSSMVVTMKKVILNWLKLLLSLPFQK